jgi:hypothetical protein
MMDLGTPSAKLPEREHLDARGFLQLGPRLRSVLLQQRDDVRFLHDRNRLAISGQLSALS